MREKFPPGGESHGLFRGKHRHVGSDPHRPRAGGDPGGLRGGGILRPRTYRQVDGLLTREPGVTLATFYADCVPLYFVDPVRRAIAPDPFRMAGNGQRIGKSHR